MGCAGLVLITDRKRQMITLLPWWWLLWTVTVNHCNDTTEDGTGKRTYLLFQDRTCATMLHQPNGSRDVLLQFLDGPTLPRPYSTWFNHPTRCTPLHFVPAGVEAKTFLRDSYPTLLLYLFSFSNFLITGFTVELFQHVVYSSTPYTVKDGLCSKILHATELPVLSASFKW